jgi:hypothetical protein
MTDLAKIVVPEFSAEDSDTLIAEASACLDRFTSAFNSCDLEGMDAQLHFPHVMLSGSELLIWHSSGQHPSGFFKQLTKTGWAKTQYERKEPVLVAKDKVHFVVEYTRRDAHGGRLTTHTNLWVIVSINGKWGIAVRSD